MLVNVTEFSKESGKSRNAIYKAIDAGRLFWAEPKKIDNESPEAVAFSTSNKSNNGGSFSTSKGGGRGLNMDRSELENERIRQQIIKLELENSIKTNAYVSRKIVKDKIILPLDDLFIRLIADMPRTILLDVKESIGAKLSDGEAERKLKKIFEGHIKRTKSILSKGLGK